jgi:serpin B
MFSTRTLSLFLALTGVVMVAGCEAQQKPQPVYVSASTPAPTTGGSTAQASEASNRFAWALWNKSDSVRGSDNYFVSPVCLSQILAMTATGTQGETSTQIWDALSLNNSSTRLGDQRTLMSSLNQAQSDDVRFTSANAFWVGHDEEIKNDYLRTMETYFQSDIQRVAFDDRAKATTAINAWEHTNTSGRISRRLSDASLENNTRMLATNTVTFHGDWASSFDPSATTNQPFRLAGGETLSVPTMHGQFQASYAQDDTFQILQLPFKGNRLVFRAMLPKNSGSLTLNEQRMTALVRNLQPTTVSVSMPRFVAQFSGDMVSPLKAMNIKKAFDGGDFTPTFYKSDHAKTQLGGMLHTTYAAFNEVGIQSSTPYTPSNSVAVSGAAQTFDANHPFVFQLVDTQTNTILFMGQMNDPTR